jgi:hypothetical protein
MVIEEFCNIIWLVVEGWNSSTCILRIEHGSHSCNSSIHGAKVRGQYGLYNETLSQKRNRQKKIYVQLSCLLYVNYTSLKSKNETKFLRIYVLTE